MYAHGDAPNQNAAVEIQSGDVIYSGKSTLNDGTWSCRNRDMSEGNQFVLYQVEVVAEQPLIITCKRDGSFYSIFNAIQLRKVTAAESNRAKRI